MKNIDLKDIKSIKLPQWAKMILAPLPAVAIVVAIIFVTVLPRNKEVELLEQDIAKQEAEIAKSQSMVARLEELKKKNEELKKKLRELEDRLPDEREISSLLKQVSDLGLEAGLKILRWKPAQKRNHPSGIVYEVPVSVSLTGSYHRLGQFFASLTRLNRIVNISNIKLGNPKLEGSEMTLNVSFSAVTFTAVKEGGITQTEKAKKGKKKKKKKK